MVFFVEFEFAIRDAHVTPQNQFAQHDKNKIVWCHRKENLLIYCFNCHIVSRACTAFLVMNALPFNSSVVAALPWHFYFNSAHLCGRHWLQTAL